MLGAQLQDCPATSTHTSKLNHKFLRTLISNVAIVKALGVQYTSHRSFQRPVPYPRIQKCVRETRACFSHMHIRSSPQNPGNSPQQVRRFETSAWKRLCLQTIVKIHQIKQSLGFLNPPFWLITKALNGR